MRFPDQLFSGPSRHLGFKRPSSCVFRWILAVFVLASFPGPAVATQRDELQFLVVPVEKETAMFRQFLPIKRCLEEKMERPVQLKLGHDAQAVAEGLQYGAWDVAYMDPALYCEIKDKYTVQPLAKLQRKNRDTYTSVLVVRSDSFWTKVADIRGASLALGQPGSSATHLIPLSLLHEADLTLSDFGQVSTLPNEDEIALSVLVGDHDVGAMSHGVYTKYASVGLRILKASEEIPQFVVCAAPDVSQKSKALITDALLSYSRRGNQELSFVPVQDREYNIVRIMIKNITGKDYLRYPPDAVKLGLLPLFSAITLNKRYTPLAAYLSEQTGRDFRLVIPKDFEKFVDIVRSGDVDFAYQNPYVYLLLAREGHLRSLALTVSLEPDQPRSSFRGVIITRKDSAIQAVDDLIGKKIMIVSFKSAGGYRFQKLFLQDQGLAIEKQADLKEAKRHEEVVLRVYRGQADAGFVRESALQVVQDLVDMDQLRVLAKTPYHPNWPFAAHTATNSSLVAAVKKNLIDLNQEDLLTKMGIEGFTDADQEKLLLLKEQVEFK